MLDASGRSTLTECVWDVFRMLGFMHMKNLYSCTHQCRIWKSMGIAKVRACVHRLHTHFSCSLHTTQRS